MLELQLLERLRPHPGIIEVDLLLNIGHSEYHSIGTKPNIQVIILGLFDPDIFLLFGVPHPQALISASTHHYPIEGGVPS